MLQTLPELLYIWVERKITTSGKKILSFHIILKYRSLPETSLGSFIKTSIVVAGSESRLQTNQPFCPCSQKVQSSKRCLHGTYCWVIRDLAFSISSRESCEAGNDHLVRLQSGGQWQDPEVAIEILEGQSIPGPSDGQRPQPGTGHHKAKGGPA